MDYTDKYGKKKRPDGDILLKERPDRRLLPHVPDLTGTRREGDRRGQQGAAPEDINEMIAKSRAGTRYRVEGAVEIHAARADGGRFIIRGEKVDISSTGLLVRLPQQQAPDALQISKTYRLRFETLGGDMPEGFEMKVRNKARLVRFAQDDDGMCLCGFAFTEPLSDYAARKKDRYMLTTASLLLFIVSFTIVLMRAESVIYFKFSKWTYLYSILAAIFLLSRYLFGAFYRPTPVDPAYTPGVSIVIPSFNEEEWIQRTILSCVDQYYPPDKLEVIVVDDCSTDKTVQKIQEIFERLNREDQDRYRTKERISYFVQPKNAGKRAALVRGAEVARHELVVFVDSDSFLDPYAIRHLVQPFKDPKMGGVTGRTDVANTYTNGLTKMQAVRYYIAFRIMKAAEALFDCVTCLSGPLSCYRKQIVLDNKEAWLNQKFFGQKATFGDDRSMTNFVLREHRTGYQDSAICSTIVPNSYSVFLRQQMRWKRSWLRESLTAGSFIWRKEPFAAVNFYIGLLVPILAPVVVIYNLIYVPLTQHIFPTTFLVGLTMMALLMSFAQLLLRRSTTWAFGLLFCLYYEAVLLWQMPVAWFTFWKSTWGTRMTPSDARVQEKREKRQAERRGRRRKGGGAQDSRQFATKKDRFKFARTVAEVVCLVTVLVLTVRALVTTTRYQPYDPTDTAVVSGTDRGFIALSYFGVDRTGTDTLISTQRLEEHLAALEALGYVTVSQDDILAYYRNGTPLPDKALYLMFEDGRRDTALFAEKILEKYNYLATVLTYAEKFETKDNKFLMPKDLRSLSKSTWWELGTNGYRLAYINAYDRYDRFLGELDSVEYIALTQYMGRDYNHYLMDYIRDEDGLPVESYTEMRDRITHDYELMESIYTEELGELPKTYVLMHANTGMFGNNDRVSDVNEECITALFDMNFNREGFSYNDRSCSLYDLTRMQPQAYWYTNHLLMRIKYDLPEEDRDFITFVDGDLERKADWEILSGAAEFKGEQIVLTSEPEGTGLMRLENFDGRADVLVTAELTGNKLGTQTIYLRADEDLTSYVAVTIQNDVLIVHQSGDGIDEELFTLELRTLDGDPVSVEEDDQAALAAELATRAQFSGSLGEWYAYDQERRAVESQEARTVAEGAREYVPELQILDLGDRTLEIRLEADQLSIQVDGQQVADAIGVDVSDGGELYLESAWGGYGYSQRNLADDVYDGVFEKLCVCTVGEEEDVLYSNVLTGWEKFCQEAARIWSGIVDWFIKNL